MVRLARSLWREFGTDIGLDITSDLDALLYRITQGGSPAGMMIVSFGHVLAQASSQKNAIAVFVDVLSRIRLNSSLVVAVDAQSDPAIQGFHRSIDRLMNA